MNTELLLAAGVGLGLAAACGFRVFLPLLVLGLGGHFGRLPLAHGFEWVATTPAMVALGVAAVLEVGAYYIPWLDHALDAVATPAAVLAGMLATASVAVDLPPLLRWAVVLIGGGGLAGIVQGTTAFLRLKSTALTGGAGNPVVATAELLGATSLSLLAVVLPLLALLLAVLIVVLAWRTARRFSLRARR